MEEKLDHRQIILASLIAILTVVGSLVLVYLLLWAWSTYGVLFYAFLAIAILGLIIIFFFYDTYKKRHRTPTRQQSGNSDTPRQTPQRSESEPSRTTTLHDAKREPLPRQQTKAPHRRKTPPP